MNTEPNVAGQVPAGAAGAGAAKEQAPNVPEPVKLRIEYINEALRAGRTVRLGKHLVRSIDVLPSKRGVVIVVNSTEVMS